MTKNESIGLPSTDSRVWGITYGLGDNVRLRRDFVKPESDSLDIDYNSAKNDFIIETYAINSYAIRPENPTGRLYHLNNNGGDWEGKDLEPYSLISLPKQETQTTQEPTTTTTTTPPINMEGDIIADFLNNNIDNLDYIQKTNKPLFDVIEMTLSFLNERFGTGESLGEKIIKDIEEVEAESEDTEQKAAESNEGLIELEEIMILDNGGYINLRGTIYTNWSDFQYALLDLYTKEESGGTILVGVVVKFKNGDSFKDAIDVGDDNFNPTKERIGDYIDRPFVVDKMNEDLDIYQWEDDDIVEIERVEGSDLTEAEIDNQIDELNAALMLEDDEEKINDINQRIEELNLSKLLI